MGAVDDGGFPARLEAEARQILRDRLSTRDRLWSPGSSVEDALAMLLHQLEETRAHERMVSDDLLREECYVGTELRQMEARTPRYSPDRFPEREKFQRRLGQLSQERRRFVTSQVQRLHLLEDRLLSLVEKHRQLTP